MPGLKLIAGKHSCAGLLSSGGVLAENKARLEKPAMLVYCGMFDSMDGPVEIEESHIDLLVKNHNERLDGISKLSSGPDHFERLMPPLQLDHSPLATHTVGRVIGRLSKGQHVNDKGETVACLLTDKVCVLGADNVEKVNDGRWANLSIGADLALGKLNELSITPFPAAGDSILLSKGEAMDEKLKKHLMEKHNLSEEDAKKMGEKMRGHLAKKLAADAAKADEQMAAMSDEEMSKLADDVKAEDKKLADDKAAADKLAADDADEGKKLSARLSAAKPNILKLAKGMKTGLASSRLKAKEQMLTAKIARLRSSAKMTPAEQKKINLTELSGKSDAELESFFKGYEIREDVIDSRIHGTTKALSLSSIARMSKETARLTLEAETRKDFGVKLSAEEEKSLADQAKIAAGEQLAEAQPHDEMLKHLSNMLAEFPAKEAVMAHVGKMMESKMAGEMAPEAAEGAEKQMSALVNDFNKLQTEFDEMVTLVGGAVGITSAELTG